MEIQYTKRKLLIRGLSEPAGPYVAELGYFLFVEAACYFGVLPPYSMLNKTLQSGRLISAKNYLLEWQPLRINRLKYEDLKWAIKQHPEWGGEVDEGFRGSRKYWDRWAMLRTLEKPVAYA